MVSDHQRGGWDGPREKPSGPINKLELNIGDVRVVWTKGEEGGGGDYKFFKADGSPVTGKQRGAYKKPAKKLVEDALAAEQAQTDSRIAAEAERQAQLAREQAERLESFVQRIKESAWDEIRGLAGSYFYGIVNGEAKYLPKYSEKDVAVAVKSCISGQSSLQRFGSGGLSDKLSAERVQRMVDDLLEKFKEDLLEIINTDSENFFVLSPDNCINKGVVKGEVWKIFKEWVITEYGAGRFRKEAYLGTDYIEYMNNPDKCVEIVEGIIMDVLAKKSGLTKAELQQQGWGAKIFGMLYDDINYYLDERIEVPSV